MESMPANVDLNAKKAKDAERFCDLCGLPCRGQAVESKASGNTYQFCCTGCLHVFRMLSQIEGLAPGEFTSSELFKKCREMGIIPSGVADKKSPGAAAPSATTGNFETLRLNLAVGGMWCPSCAWVIDACLAKMPGIVSTACRFSTDTLQCDYDPVRTSPRQIIQQIEQLGYSTHGTDEAADRREDRSEFIRLTVSAFLTMNIMMLSAALYTGYFRDLGHAGIRFLSIPIFLMALVVFFYGGKNIHGKGLRSLAFGAYGMETLISVGASIVFAYSVWGMIDGSLHLYFDTSSMLITLVLLGKMLERRAKKAAQKDLMHFFSMVPSKARVCTPTDKEGRYVSADHLQPNDLLRLMEGEVAPVDGIVTEGVGFGDESALTGESKPRRKTIGDTVVSGTRLVNGELYIRAVHVGHDSTLGQMIELMETALGGKTSREAHLDRLLRWFVPSVFVLAAATGIVLAVSGQPIERALLRMITVLVVSCPCALGIAIPLTRSVGIAAAGRKGILIRDVEAFDRATAIESILFDKTGTVTSGVWQLLAVNTMPPCTRSQALELAAGLEKDSQNTAAIALVRHAKAAGILAAPVDGIIDHENGRTGWLQGKKLKIGSADFMGDATEKSVFDVANHQPVSKIYLSYSGEVMAVFVFGDTLRPETQEAMTTLKQWGLRLGIVSGDGDRTTGQIAKQLGIPEWQGDLLPDQKMNIVRQWQASGAKVAVVGDGVNDAPALAQSDLGIAVKAGAPLGKETAHVTLMRGELTQVIDFLNLAGMVRNKVRQNLFLTVLYNVTCIPIAMAGFLSPLIAVCAMLLSSLSVIGNTLLLVRATRQ